MKKELPFVSVIIVNYNGRQLLKDCLDSLSRLNYDKDRFEVIIVDNGSIDDSVEYVKKNYSKAKIIKNKINNYCRANNLGIKKSKGEFVALLNNDTMVDKDWLRELTDVITADSKIGCCGSKILFPDKKIQSASHYEFPNFYWGDRGLREPDVGQYEFLEEVTSLSGAAVLFRRGCLQDVGHIDEDFVMYLEDVDMFLRCRQKGWKLLYVPKSIVYHKFHSTADEKLVRFFIERNRLLLIAKHFPKELDRAIETCEHFLNNEEFFKILPDIFLKLIRNHDLKIVEPLMGYFFISLKRLYNFSKDKGIQEMSNLLKIQEDKAVTLNHEKEDACRAKIQSESGILKLEKEIEINRLKLEELKEASNARVSLEKALNQKIQEMELLKYELSDKQHKIELIQMDSAHRQEIFQEIEKQRNDLLNQTYKYADQVNQLQEKIKQFEIEQARLVAYANVKAAEKEKMEQQNTNLQQQINDILNSKTYRYLAVPLWRISDFTKSLKNAKNKKAKKILIIKPYYVSVESTEKALEELRNSFINSRIVLFANLFGADYEYLMKNSFADGKLFYSPDYNKLTKFRLMNLLFRLNLQCFNEAIVLIGPPAYQSYRKAKLFAFFSGAKSIKLYFIETKTMAPLYSLNMISKIKIATLLLWRTILFINVVLFFVAFIVMPIKIKKMFQR